MQKRPIHIKRDQQKRPKIQRDVKCNRAKYTSKGIYKRDLYTSKQTNKRDQNMQIDVLYNRAQYTSKETCTHQKRRTKETKNPKRRKMQ